MNKTVLFRDFEERDIDFIYQCKNDEKLNSLVVGAFHPYTYEEAVKWVHGCMGEHDTFKFWAICTNDEEKRIVGWAALSAIDRENKTVNTHSIVIADSDYHDGFSWIESALFLLEYSFEVLQLNRVYGTSIVGHPMSNRIGKLLFMQTEGIFRQAICKYGQFYDLQYDAILKSEYLEHKNAGDYELPKIIKRLRKLRNE